MKFKKYFILTLCIFLISGCTNNKSTKKPVSKEVNEGGAYEEMNQASFWIDQLKDPDKIIMDQNKIEQFNNEVPNIEATDCVDINTYPLSLSKEELLQKLHKYNVPEEPRYLNETLLDNNYYQNLLRQRNEENIREENAVRKGIILENTQIRTWPSSDVSYSEANDVDFDLNSESLVKTNEAVLVLHTSMNQEWYYVQTYNYLGWVSAKDVAFYNDEQWNQQINNKDWLVVTGNRITLDHSNVNPNISKKELTMGTKLMLINDKPALLDNVSTMGSYVALLPTKTTDGSLQLIETRVPKNLDVSVGFLAYTKNNIITQSFKLLGERYGWGSSMDARDCSSYTMDVYQCFGISLPRNTEAQVEASKNTLDVSSKSDEDKQAEILKQLPGTLLGMNQHIMIYLGEYEGKPYVIHQIYGFTPKGKDETAIIASVVVTNLEILRANKYSYLREISHINSIQ